MDKGEAKAEGGTPAPRGVYALMGWTKWDKTDLQVVASWNVCCRAH